VSCWAFSTEWQHYRTAITRYNITFISYFFFLFLSLSFLLCFALRPAFASVSCMCVCLRSHTTQFVDLSLSHYISFLALHFIRLSLSFIPPFRQKKFPRLHFGVAVEREFRMENGQTANKREKRKRKKERRKKKHRPRSHLLRIGPAQHGLEFDR
jgi:hypothetical protein